MTGFGHGRAARPGGGFTTSTTSRSPARCTPSAVRARRRLPPLNLVGDFGGGAACSSRSGVLCGLLETQKSGKGQVVDAAMVDGAAYLLAGIYGLYSQGSWADERGVNFVDSGAPWYDVYKTKDGKWLSVGAIEKRFYEELVEKLGLASAGLPKQHDRRGWPVLKERFVAAIASKTRDEWERVFEGSDACVAPVLALGEVEKHPHNVARRTFVRRDGVLQPGPAPRFLPHQERDGPRPARSWRRQRGHPEGLGFRFRRDRPAEQDRCHRRRQGGAIVSVRFPPLPSDFAGCWRPPGRSEL